MIDKQRQQDYLDLIQHFLYCSNRDEVMTLAKTHADLVDAELLQLMRQMIRQLRRHRSETANVLDNLAQQLSQLIRTSTDRPGLKTALKFVR